LAVGVAPPGTDVEVVGVEVVVVLVVVVTAVVVVVVLGWVVDEDVVVVATVVVVAPEVVVVVATVVVVVGADVEVVEDGVDVVVVLDRDVVVVLDGDEVDVVDPGAVDEVDPGVVELVLDDEDEDVDVVDCVTVTAAVSPVGATEKLPASAPALFKYVPGVVDTVTPKCNVTFPPAATLNGPVQVRACPLTVGFAVVTPVVEPAVYAKPAGSVSEMELSVTWLVLGLLTVIV
jgi:hypothetical protein